MAVRQCAPMTARRDRPSQVRPRPPSSGRPRQLPPAPRRPVIARSVGLRASEPARGMPLPVRLVLSIAIVALAAVIVTTVTGALPRMVSSFGTAIGGITDSVLRTPVPSASLAAIPESPALVAPENPYTNNATTSLAGTVPAGVAGRPGYLIRIYVALTDQEPVVIREVTVGETTSFVVEDVPLEPGRNDVSASLVGPGGESEISPAITYVYDRSKPAITVTSPKNKATVNGTTVKITGKTQGRATVVARNEANGTSATATATDKGVFTLKVPLSSGTNGIALTATDLAGNVATAVLTVRRGSGKLSVALSASAYRISAARLPRSIELRAIVTDPNGRPLASQTVTFTLTISGVPALTGEDVTDGSGAATFRTTIPKGATVGSGLGTASVSTTEFGDASARPISITIIK